jgi:hypothetical protein
MLQLTPEAAVYLRKVLSASPAENDVGSLDVLRVAPATAEEIRGLKISFVTYAGEHDSVTETQGFYLCVDPEFGRALDDKLIDLTPGGESVHIRSARVQ